MPPEGVASVPVRVYSARNPASFPRSRPPPSASRAWWAADHRRVGCEGRDDKPPSSDGIYTISSSNGGVPQRLTANPLGGHDLPGAYSPDGKRIVFSRFDKNGSGIGLFVINADG